MPVIRGSFDVKTIPQSAVSGVGDAAIGRRALDKRFHGELEAASAGEMLGAMSPVQPMSGGYVALERVVGTLDGRSGTFMLQHSSTMTRGAQSQHIVVVPDSGTDALLGLTGTMSIEIVEKAHFYVFDYTLPP